MHTKEPKEDPLVDLGYETRDIDTKTIERAVMWFFTFATAMFIAGAWIYANINPAFSPKYIAQKEDLRIPKAPNPLLQTNTTNFTDIMKLRQHETAVLNSVGYSDASQSSGHIRIEDAISILSQRGLPKTNANVPAVSKGNTTDQRKDEVPAQAVAPASSNGATSNLPAAGTGSTPNKQ